MMYNADMTKQQQIDAAYKEGFTAGFNIRRVLQFNPYSETSDFDRRLLCKWEEGYIDGKDSFREYAE